MYVNPIVTQVAGSQLNSTSDAKPTTTTLPQAFADVLNDVQQVESAQTADNERVGFTDMTRQEMRDWVNNQIRSGEMSVDESRPFMFMTIQGVGESDLQVADDNTHYNFMQMAEDGLNAALQRRDSMTAELLKAALAKMQMLDDGSRIDAKD